MRNLTEGAAGIARPEQQACRKVNENGVSRCGKCVWTLAVALHISTAMPIRANQERENKMAKKKLKKSKKLQATKPLLVPFGKK
jgi:hypothetical protein